MHYIFGEEGSIQFSYFTMFKQHTRVTTTKAKTDLSGCAQGLRVSLAVSVESMWAVGAAAAPRQVV